VQGVPLLGGVKQWWGGENKPFSGFKRQYIENGRPTSKVTINDQ